MVHVGPWIAHQKRSRSGYTVMLIAIFFTTEDSGHITTGRKSHDGIILHIYIEFFLMLRKVSDCSRQIMHRCMVGTMTTHTIFQHEGVDAHLVQLRSNGISLILLYQMIITAAGTYNCYLAMFHAVRREECHTNRPTGLP